MTRITATPLPLGPVTLRNRLTTAPMERNYCDTEGHLTDQYLAYLMERVRAGAALVTVEATYVRQDGKGRTHQLGLHDDTCIAPLRRFTDAAHAEGALVGVELNHGGRTAQSRVTGEPTVAPSAVACPPAGGQVPRALATREAHEVAEAYGAAAARAVAAGCDVVTVHGAHGYLVHQFMSPISNHRTDEFAVPHRFLDRVLEEVRAAAPSATLGLRVSVLEGPPEGVSAAQQVEVLERADLGGLHFLDLSAGSYDAGEWIVPSGEWKPAVLEDYAAAYRRFGLPLGMAGRLNSPEVVERVLADGTADFVSVGRAQHADPAFLAACLTGGTPYRPCIACNVCIDRLGAGQVTCSVNPTVGRGSLASPTARVPGLPVTVVGGGPAGITAARELALAGARVTLRERATGLGGDMAQAATMDSTPDFGRYLEWAAAELPRVGVEVVLGSECGDDGERLDGEVLALIGAEPVVPPALRAAAAVPAGEWLAAGGLDDAVAGRVGHVTIVGADAVAMSLADTLSARGVAVVVVGEQVELAPESGRRAKILAVPRLLASPLVELRLGTAVVGSAPGRLSLAPVDATTPVRHPVAGSSSKVPEAPGVPATPGVLEVPGLLLVTPAAGTVSQAVKAGYDIARCLATRLGGPPGDTPSDAVDAHKATGSHASTGTRDATNPRDASGAREATRATARSPLPEASAGGGRRRLGLAHLSLLDVSPPDLVDVAADAGYDFVGLRVRSLQAASAYDLRAGSPMLRETVARCSERGITVEDTEFLLLDGRLGRDDWLPALESAAALGAATMTVAIDDGDDERTRATLRRLVSDADAVGIGVALEPITYNTLHSVPAAAMLAREAGCRVVLDTLHLTRFGATSQEVADLLDVEPLLQLCDAPATRPTDRAGLVAESRVERAVPGEGVAELTGLLRALPPGLPVSVECPSARARLTLSPTEWATRLRVATITVLHAADTRLEQR